jgi:hypothetical protein
MIKQLYTLVVVGKQKALVAFVVATVGSYVARHGWTLNMTLGEALQSLFIGLVAHLSVFTKRNG